MGINYYGFFVSLGILTAVLVIEQVRKSFYSQSSILNTKFSILKIDVFTLLPWVLIPGIAGARVYHVLDYWRYYLANPGEIIKIWHGGLGIYGGLLGGIIGIFIFLQLKTQMLKLKTTTQNSKLFENFLSLLDLIVIGLPLGQAIGRIGNYFNEELYGLPTKLPWGVYISFFNRLPGYEGFDYFHPLFFYEAILCLLIFLILITNYQLLITQKKAGTVFFLYLFLYSFGRFWLEFLRIESWVIGGVRVNQIVSLVLMIISGYILVNNKRL